MVDRVKMRGRDVRQRGHQVGRRWSRGATELRRPVAPRLAKSVTERDEVAARSQQARQSDGLEVRRTRMRVALKLRRTELPPDNTLRSYFEDHGSLSRFTLPPLSTAPIEVTRGNCLKRGSMIAARTTAELGSISNLARSHSSRIA